MQNMGNQHTPRQKKSTQMESSDFDIPLHSGDRKFSYSAFSDEQFAAVASQNQFCKPTESVL
jgi:hypothetical protein